MAPQRTQPGRSLAFVLIVLLGLYAGLFFGDGGHGRTPVLGIDLAGGAQVTLTATPIGGTGHVSQTELSEAVNILRNRVDGAGVSGASINKQGSDEIVVTVIKGNQSVLNLVQHSALLSFRQVLELREPASTTTTPTTVPSESTPTTNATSSAKSTAKARATVKAKSTKSSSGDALTPALERGKAHQKRKARQTSKSTTTPTAATSASATAPVASTTSSASTSSASTPSTTLTPTPAPAASAPPTSKTGDVIKRGSFVVASPTLADVETTLGSAAFDCASLDNNPINGDDIPNDYVISCDSNGDGLIYLLAPSEPTSSWTLGGVKGDQVSSASSGVDATVASQYDVNVNWKSKGQTEWQALTAATYNAPSVSTFSSTGTSTCTPPTGCNQVAIMLDGQVVSAPASTTKGGIAGATQITGAFTQSQASQLADILSYGSLPLQLKAQNPEVISATLGTKQLRGGLIAGVISLILVALFCLVYYRALGMVAIASLIMSGLILYSVTTLLGHSSLAYTLSLAGIAGFIVAVGITADSFVVFFERLRDEIREGRRLRSSVDRAWPRARRTIISADAVSLLAAVILYIVSISDVRGFAFTLGLSTISDLFIVFFFTKPLMTLLSRRKAFDNGAPWTGLARARTGRGAAELTHTSGSTMTGAAQGAGPVDADDLGEGDDRG